MSLDNMRSRLRQTWQEKNRIVPLCDDESPNERDGLTSSVFAGSPGLSPLGLPAGIDFDREADLIRKELWRLVGSHADMVVAVAIFDEPQNEIAERLGISETAGRKRFQRALKQLRKEYGFA